MKRFTLSLVALSTSLYADQLALWDFDDNAPLSGIVSGTAITPDQEYVFGVPTLQPFNQDIDSNGKAGNNYTDSLGIEQDSPDLNDAIAWNDIRGSGADGELVLSINTTEYQNLALSFEYKYLSNNDGSGDLMELLYSSNGGASYTKFGGSFSVIDDDSWRSVSFNLSSVGAIDDNPNVRFKIQIDGAAPAAQEVNDEIRFDNIEITGSNFHSNSNAPALTASSTTTPFLSLFTDPVGFVNGTIGDPTDPAATDGIIFDIDDPNGAAFVNLSATSSNTSVVTNANLSITYLTATTRRLRITPTGVGTTTITVVATDPGGLTDFYLIEYAASGSSSTPDESRFHTLRADASTAVDIGATYMWVADDEDQVLRLYDRQNSGWRVKGLNFNTSLGLSPGDEADLEASAKSGNTVYWMGSHGNKTDGTPAPERAVIFRTTLSGSGAGSSLSYNGRNNNFRSDVIAWDVTNGHGLGANFLGLSVGSVGIPERTAGFNIEGLAMMPSSTTGALVGFRAPLINDGGINKALLVPVTNFSSVATGSSPTFASPILLNLGGRGIRSITRNANNDYLIVAGPPASSGSFALYLWNGNAASAPSLLSTDIAARATNADSSPEGVVGLNDDLSPCTKVQIIMDSGGGDFYNFGLENKKIPVPRWKKFRTDVIEIPPQSNTYTVTTSADSGVGSLRHLVECANATPGRQTIKFSLGNNATITLATEIKITDDLEIIGSGALDLTLSGNGSTRLFSIQDTSVVLEEMLLSNGKTSGDGGAIHVSGSRSDVTVELCELIDHQAAARGGAIYIEDGTLNLRDSTIAGCAAGTNGGGINANVDSTVSLAQSTISGNKADESGAGLVAFKSTVRILSSTITDNLCDADDSGIPGNGGGFAVDPTTLFFIGNSIVAANQDGSSSGNSFPDLFGNVTSLGNNLVGDTSGSLGIIHKQNDDLAGDAADPLDPILGPLAANGGTTRTHEPMIGSPAMEAGSAALFSDPAFGGVPPSKDQRGLARVLNNFPDVGAVEFQPYHVTVTILDGTGAESAVGSNSISLRFTRDRPGPPLQIPYTILTGTSRSSPSEMIFSSPRIAFPLNGTQFDLTATPIDDLLVEGTETLTVYFIGGPHHTTPGSGLYDLDVLDNDFLVDTYIGSGTGSLPAAVATLNSLGGGSISFDTTLSDPVALPRTVVLPAPLTLKGKIALRGPTDNAAGVTLSGNGSHRILTVIGASEILLENLTLSNGNAAHGAALLVEDSAQVNALRCTFSNNVASGNGGAISSSTSGGLLLRNCTLSDNLAADDGGAVFGNGGTIEFVHTTITNNACDADGNGNGDGGGVFIQSGMATLLNTIVAGNTCKNGGPIDIGGNLFSLKGNLIGNNLGGPAGFSAGQPNGTPDYVGSSSSPLNPRLFPLAFNGGPTKTHALGCSSPALDNASSNGLSLDQRSLPRPANSDIGAVEHQFLPYNYWAEFAFPKAPNPATLYDAKLDFDQDGSPNGLERLFATDPLNAESNTRPNLTVTSALQLGLSFPRAFTVDPAEFSVQRSFDLDVWKENEITIQTLCPPGAMHPTIQATFASGGPWNFGRVGFQP